ncbi:MAG: 23S rRNA (guanosine(2251)-2'-O)-methyltransferase RlmB [Chitinophagales bacterium]|nr:23S rRNA (guanosine(2251)-2'-O)-methyltransferase RlmB [Chitinophagales bacterium]
MKNSRIIAGKNPVLEAIDAGVSIDKIFIQKDKKGKGLSDIYEGCKREGIPLQFVPPEKINRILGPKQKMQSLNHQGILAITSLIQYYDVEDVISFKIEKGEVPFLCMLDRVTDVRNLGAIARSAVAFGVDALVIPKTEGADINEFAVKSSAGALEKIHVCRSSNLVNTIKQVKLHGIEVIASDMNGKPMGDLQFKDKPIMIILGSEDRGVDVKLLKVSDYQLSIPMSGKMESLNVSVAAGIIFYEISKLRNTIQE